MNPELRSLLDTVLAYPEDDTPRLIYADWLEEHGESERAEMIRRQARYASLKCEMWDGIHCDTWNDQLGEGRVLTWCPACKESNEIVTKHMDCAIKTGGVPIVAQMQQCHREPLLREITGLPAFDNTMGTGHPTLGKQCTPIYRRGFVDEVSCTMACWMEFAEEIMRWHPVRRVSITDKIPIDNEGVGTYFGEPRNPADEWYWIEQFGDCPPTMDWEVPKPIFKLLEKDHFSSEPDAFGVLSDACIQFVKGK